GFNPAYNVTVSGLGCPSTPLQLQFWPTLPFPLWGPEGANPLAFNNNTYSCLPRLPNFVGWDNIYKVLANAVAAATSKGLKVNELDLENEISLAYSTYYARMIVDTKHPDNQHQYDT